MDWIAAVRHVLVETLTGLRGGLEDIAYVRRIEADPFTPAEVEVLARAGMPPDRHPFATARSLRRHRERQDEDEASAEKWLAEFGPYLPGLRELAAVGDRPLIEFRSWMTRPHRWLPDDDMWPQGVWGAERPLIEEKWRAHVEQGDRWC